MVSIGVSVGVSLPGSRLLSVRRLLSPARPLLSVTLEIFSVDLSLLVAAGLAGALLGGRRHGHGVGGGDGSEDGGGRREGGHGHDVEPGDRRGHPVHPTSTALSHHPHLTFVAHPGVLKIV